ncbi:MAG: pitrilysin family protein [Clostridium sp.]|nr:pitrilysin family protein [Clostridium sp.]
MIKLNFDVKKHFLDNGLKVITIKKDSQMCAINVGVNVGALNENIDEKGISHFIEHMLFKGTKKRNNDAINDDLEFLGGEYNAYTDYDSTVYTIACLLEELENAVEIIGDIIVNSDFPEEELEKERGVILSEIRISKDDIEDYSFKKVNEAAFEGGLKYDVTGTEEVVKKLTRNEIYSYYKKYYMPNNALVTIVSPLEHEESLKIVNKYFNMWEKSNIEEETYICEKNKHIMETTYKDEIEQSTITYLYTFADLTKEEELPLRILNHRLGESSNSLLFREIREKRGLAYDVSTQLDITRKLKNFSIYTAVADENVEEALEAINDTIEGVKSGNLPFCDKDLIIMKKVHKTAVINTLEDSAELCNYILHQELDEDDIFEFVKDMDRLNELSAEDIRKVAQKVLINPTIHILRRTKND